VRLFCDIFCIRPCVTENQVAAPGMSECSQSHVSTAVEQPIRKGDHMLVKKSGIMNNANLLGVPVDRRRGLGRARCAVNLGCSSTCV
jgi:hypothetical protein